MNQSAEFELFKSKLLEVLKSTLPGRNVDDHDIIFDQEERIALSHSLSFYQKKVM